MACLMKNGKKQVGAAVVSYVDPRTGEVHFLVGSKKNFHQQIYFVAPGGEIETTDKSIEQGTLRELYEETGFDFERYRATHPHASLKKTDEPLSYPNRDVHYLHLDLGYLTAEEIILLKKIVRTVNRSDLNEVQFAPASRFGYIGQPGRLPVQKDNLKIFKAIQAQSPGQAPMVRKRQVIVEAPARRAHLPMPAPHMTHRHRDRTETPGLSRTGPHIRAATFGNALLLASGSTLMIIGVVAMCTGLGTLPGALLLGVGTSLTAYSACQFFKSASRPSFGTQDRRGPHAAGPRLSYATG